MKKKMIYGICLWFGPGWNKDEGVCDTWFLEKSAKYHKIKKDALVTVYYGFYSDIKNL
jgi:hypothetical protein